MDRDAGEISELVQNRLAIGRVVTAVDNGRAGFDALLFPACAAGSRGFSRPFWRCAWWFAGLSGATKNTSDVICNII